MNSASSAKSAAAGWGLSTRPSSFRSAGGLRSRSCPLPPSWIKNRHTVQERSPGRRHAGSPEHRAGFRGRLRAGIPLLRHAVSSTADPRRLDPGHPQKLPGGDKAAGIQRDATACFPDPRQSEAMVSHLRKTALPTSHSIPSRVAADVHSPLTSTPGTATSDLPPRPPGRRRPHHAHELGIVHRDIKPANLCRRAAANFGSPTSAWPGSTATTRPYDDRRLVGTLRYMSPEQALAKRVVVDHRTDIYSLGVTLYELLAARPAFDGDDRQELLRQIAFEEPTPLRRRRPDDPGASWRRSSLKAIAKEPGRSLRDGPGTGRRSYPVPGRPADPGPTADASRPADQALASTSGGGLVRRGRLAAGGGWFVRGRRNLIWREQQRDCGGPRGSETQRLRSRRRG